METEPGPDDEGPFFSWLPPEDRLWRHPSEVPSAPTEGTVTTADRRTFASLTSGTGRLWTVAVIAGLIGAAAASGIGIMSGAYTPRATTVLRAAISPAPAVTIATSAPVMDWYHMDNAVLPSVVSVVVLSASTTAGSGLILFDGSGDAYVITDRSLFSEADSIDDLDGIQVTFQSGITVRGDLVGEDTLSGLALIKVPNDRSDAATLGSVADLHVADSVMMLGAGESEGGSAFSGSVSAEGQTITLPQGPDMDNLIAVSTAAMSTSVSGGPVLNDLGLVVGISVNVNPVDEIDSQLHYAVPIDEAYRIALELAQGHPRTHPWIGVTSAKDVPPSVAQQFGVPGGVQALSVYPEGPASRAGITAGAIITSLDGQLIDSTGSLIATLNSCRPGKEAAISYVERGRTHTTEVAITNEPANA